MGVKAVLFGRDHAYGYRPPEQTLNSPERAQELHDELFQPAHAALVVVGDVTPAQLDESAARWLGAWTTRRALPKSTAPPPPLNGPRVAVVRRRNNSDGYAAVFARGPDGMRDDSEAFELVAKILGGSWSSKLYEHLREGSEAAYGVATPTFVQREASWLVIGTTYQNDKAVDSVRDVLAATERLRNGSVTDDEIEVARETVLAEWRGIMSTVEGAAAAYAAWIAHGLEPGRIDDYSSRIARVRRDDVERVAKVYLDPKALHVVFMGEDRWLDPSPLGMGGAKIIDIDK